MNNCSYGGALLLENEAEVFIADTSFSYNNGTRAGVIYASAEPKIRIERCFFYSNIAATSGSAIVAYEIRSHNFTILSSTFSNNFAE